MFNTPMKLGQKIAVSTPNRRVESLEIEPRQLPFFAPPEPVRMVNDPIFHYTWKRMPDLFTPPVEGIVEFANCRNDEEGVCRFLRKYGPLFVRQQNVDAEDFGFPLQAWSDRQRQFCFVWDGFLGLESRYPGAYIPYLKEHAPNVFEPLKSVRVEGHFELTKQGLEFVADSLYDALCLILMATHEKGRLRHCAKPDCENPYFLATHPKQRYCTELCAEWAQSQAKTAWWKESGKQWLQKRSKTAQSLSESKPKARRKTDGTKKTR